ncbi:MAG: hypothetical protein M1826_006943 [Phylliscum demangeonii]|nr:MAG: hypothetical protein M1826_006943 [Phylliscum demangeonii]
MPSDMPSDSPFQKTPRRRPKTDFFPREWREWRGFPPVMLKSLSKMAITTVNDLKWSDLDRSVTMTAASAVEHLTDTLPTLASDQVFNSSDGVRLAVFLQAGLDRPWKQERQGEIVRTVAEALHTLYASSPPLPPTTQDPGLAEHQQALHHFCPWPTTGRSRHCPVRASEVDGGGQRLNAVFKFFRHISPLTQTISMLFEAIDLAAYLQYKKVYTHWRQQTALNAIHMTNRACFSGVAVIKNLRVPPRNDTDEPQGGWVAVTCVGDYDGGELVIPALKCKISLQPGDVLFFRSAVLEHWVAPFTGERYALVYFSEDDDDLED